MNSDIVKPEKFGHLHLVDHFTVPLMIIDMAKALHFQCFFHGCLKGGIYG